MIKNCVPFLKKVYRQIMELLKKLFLLLIRFYQVGISPFIGPHCRFQPTCSQYAIIAINRYGVGKGTYLAVRRLLKCHPFHKGGYDPVP